MLNIGILKKKACWIWGFWTKKKACWIWGFWTKIPKISNLKLIFKPIRKLFRKTPNISKFILSELHLKKFWAKSENFFFDHHPPPPSTTIHHHPPPSVTLKNSRGQKWAETACKFKWKKLLLGPEIKQKEIKLGPHRGSPKGWSRHGG